MNGVIMKLAKNNLLLGLVISCVMAVALKAATIRLDEFDLSTMTTGWGTAQKDLSITKQPISIGGVKFEHGVGTHANSDFFASLDGMAKLFSAKVGVDDDANSDSAAVEFIIYGNGRVLWRSGTRGKC